MKKSFSIIIPNSRRRIREYFFQYRYQSKLLNNSVVKPRGNLKTKMAFGYLSTYGPKRVAYIILRVKRTLTVYHHEFSIVFAVSIERRLKFTRKFQKYQMKQNNNNNMTDIGSVHKILHFFLLCVCVFGFRGL